MRQRADAHSTAHTLTFTAKATHSLLRIHHSRTCVRACTQPSNQAKYPTNWANPSPPALACSVLPCQIYGLASPCQPRQPGNHQPLSPCCLFLLAAPAARLSLILDWMGTRLKGRRVHVMLALLLAWTPNPTDPHTPRPLQGSRTAGRFRSRGPHASGLVPRFFLSWAALAGGGAIIGTQVHTQVQRYEEMSAYGDTTCTTLLAAELAWLTGLCDPNLRAKELHAVHLLLHLLLSDASPRTQQANWVHVRAKTP